MNIDIKLTFNCIYDYILLPFYSSYRKKYMNIIKNDMPVLNDVQHQAMVDLVITDAPAIAASFGWDPTAEWVKNLIDVWAKSSWLGNVHTFRYKVARSFDPSSYWEYIDTSRVVYVTATYDSNTNPSPVAIVAREQDIVSTSEILGYGGINKIVVGGHETQLYWSDSRQGFVFTSCGRSAIRDALKAKNASRLLEDLIGITINWEEIVQPDTYEYNNIIFQCKEDGKWTQSIDEKASLA